MRAPRLAAVLVLAITTLAACSPSPARRSPSQAPTPPSQAAAAQSFAKAEGPRGLNDYLRNAFASQYGDLSKISSPPPRGLIGKYYEIIVSEQVRLILGSDVASFAHGPEGLAIGQQDGLIQVFGDWPCSSVMLPGGLELGRVAWSPRSPIMAATCSRKNRLFLYDLRSCTLVADLPLKNQVTHMELSSEGSWLAVAEAGHDLFVGRAGQSDLRELGVLRYQILALDFTPREGVLMVADQAGWLTMWAPLSGKQLHKGLIPGGPFASARFQGALLLLTTTEGEPISYDVAAQQIVATRPEPSRFDLDGGVLSYRSADKRPVKKMIMAPPAFKVFFQESTNTIRVHDLDGAVRRYSAEDGLPAPARASNGDWTPIPVDSSGRFNLHGRQYALAARAAQWEHLRLNCRTMGDHAFALWWSETLRPDEFDPRPGLIPKRRSILADGSLTWTPVEPADDLL